MASSGSSKELCKAITAFMQEPVLPLPAELNAVIESYIEKHEVYDDGASDRLNEGLLAVYEKHVHNNPSKFGPFLAAIRPLRPILRTPSRILVWWDRLFEPVLEVIVDEKGLANEATESIMDLMMLDYSEPADSSSETGSNVFVDNLLKRWMQLHSIVQAGAPAVDHIRERIVSDALLAFGAKAPKSFMVVLDGFVVKKDYRIPALYLLCEFLHSEPPHLYLVEHTPLLSTLFQTLQKDTSTKTVGYALAALVMFMPHMPSSLVSYLPTMFNIYARLLFWEQDRQFEPESLRDGALPDSTEDDQGWEKCSFDVDFDVYSINQLPKYFTMLYGLYPINFVDYIRKPQRYLRHANNAEDIDVQASEIRDRSERFRKLHLLHPNFYNLTIESEKTDLGRFLKSESAEVFADCMALSLLENTEGDHSGSAALLHPLHGTDSPSSVDGTDQDGLDHALLSGSGSAGTPSLRESTLVNWPHTHSTMRNSLASRSSLQSIRESAEAKVRDGGPDSPTLPPHMARSSSHTQLQDMIHSNRVIKSGLHQTFANDSVASLSLSNQESVPEKGPNQTSQPRTSQPQTQVQSLGSAPETAGQVLQLYQRNLLLQNDLQFERYIKQQHMTHIGELRRKLVREAATEAETQNLVMGNRALRHRLEEAKRGEIQIKKESDSRRNMAKKWEADLTAKLKTLREEQKKWAAVENSLKVDLEAARSECERLRKVVNEAEMRGLRAEQSLKAIDMNTEEIEQLKKEIARLTATERRFQAKEQEMNQAIEYARVAASRAKQLAVDLETREEKLLQTRRVYEAQVADLNRKLSEAVKGNGNREHPDVASVYESALASSRAKQSDLQKQYQALMRKYTVLQSSLFDIQCDAAEKRMSTTHNISASPEADLDGAILGGSPSNIRGRVHRGFSDPETFDAVAYNTTPPLEPVTSAGSGTPRPSTPVGTAVGETSKGSPQGDRYFGRGGVQNAIRKDRKDKKEDKPDKKDKKGPGIRGIRGFV